MQVEPREHWRAPEYRIKVAIGDLIDRGVYSEPGTGESAEIQARFIGTRRCLSPNSGTSAVLAAYSALGIGEGDELIHPAYTWVCSIAPAVLLGAKPVFCEIVPGTLTIDSGDLERRTAADRHHKRICATFDNDGTIGSRGEVGKLNGFLTSSNFPRSCGHLQRYVCIMQWPGQRGGGSSLW